MLFKDKEIVKVNSIYLANDENHDVNGYYIGNYKRVELTEDILLKCGFKVLENQPRKWFKIKTKKRGISLEICFSSKRIVLNNGYDFIDLLYVKYLHQLQNLYFCLCNQELTINL